MTGVCSAGQDGLLPMLLRSCMLVSSLNAIPTTPSMSSICKVASAACLMMLAAVLILAMPMFLLAKGRVVYEICCKSHSRYSEPGKGALESVPPCEGSGVSPSFTVSRSTSGESQLRRLELNLRSPPWVIGRLSGRCCKLLGVEAREIRSRCHCCATVRSAEIHLTENWKKLLTMCIALTWESCRGVRRCYG